jgi:putative protease
MSKIRRHYWVVFMAEEQKSEEKALGQEVGKITHYYTHIGVGVVKLSDTLKAGDKIRIKGATTDFEQTVDSMQIEKDKIEEAKKGQSIGLKVKDHVRQHDVVYKVE